MKIEVKHNHPSFHPQDLKKQAVGFLLGAFGTVFVIVARESSFLPQQTIKTIALGGGFGLGLAGLGPILSKIFNSKLLRAAYFDFELAARVFAVMGPLTLGICGSEILKALPAGAEHYVGGVMGLAAF